MHTKGYYQNGQEKKCASVSVCQANSSALRSG